MEESDMAKLKVLSWRRLDRDIEENNKIPQSEYPVSGPRFQPRTSQLRSRSSNNSAVTLGLVVLLPGHFGYFYSVT